MSQSNELCLTDIIAPNYYSLHNSIKRYEYSSFWLRGGRGSLKSSFAALEIVLGMIDDPRANALALRKVDNTIRRSVMETFLWAIDLLGLSECFDYTRSPAEITYIPTGQKIMMAGLDDPRKIKSIRVKKGIIKYLWFEEAEEFLGDAEMRSVRQSAFRGAGNFIEFVTFNPPIDPDSWINIACLQDKPQRLIHESNYLQVPREWLGEQFFRDAEDLKRISLLSYEHEYMGLAIGLTGEVFKWDWFGDHNFGDINAFTQIVHSWDTAYGKNEHGDPSACTVWGIKDNNAYLIHVVNELLDFSALKKACIEMCEKYPPYIVLIEDKASGQSLIQELKEHTNYPVKAVQIPPRYNKIARANDCVGMIEAGRVFVPHYASWLDAYKKQLIMFSNNPELQKKQKDDMVDSTSQFINWWRGSDNGFTAMMEELLRG